MRLSRRKDRIDIEPYRKDLAQYLESQRDILAAYLYGSYGTPHQTPLSDVDLALLFYKDTHPGLQRVLALEADISGICHEEDVNVLVLNYADVMLQFRVIQTGRAVFEREPEKVSDFREHVFRVYWDFEPFYRAMCDEYDQTLREAYVRDRPKQDPG